MYIGVYVNILFFNDLRLYFSVVCLLLNSSLLFYLKTPLIHKAMTYVVNKYVQYKCVCVRVYFSFFFFVFITSFFFLRESTYRYFCHTFFFFFFFNATTVVFIRLSLLFVCLFLF